MSAKCDYVYVQGLRFRTQDVTLVRRNESGLEEHTALHKTGLGRPPLDQYGNPASLSPKELKKMLEKGETIDACVYVREPGSRFPTRVNLKLDPWAAEGRKGRNSFTPDILENMEPRYRRLLALMQLQTAPYGRENRDQAVERLLWSLENLSDGDIASMLRLPTEKAPARETSSISHLLPEDRSSTPAELAALLLSDERLIRSLLQAGSHDSLRRLSFLSMVAPAMLDGAPTRSLEGVYERVALEVFAPESVSSPSARRNALRYIQKLDVLEGILLTDEDPEVRVAAMARLKAWTDSITDSPHSTGRSLSPVFTTALQSDPSPEVRLEALEYVSDDVAVTTAAMTDEDPRVRVKAVDRIDADSALLRVAKLSGDAQSRNAAYDRVFERIARGAYPQQRGDFYYLWSSSSSSSVTDLSTQLAGSDDPAILERLVDTLAAKSGSSRSEDLKVSINALAALRSNASASDELRKRASESATTLRVSLHEARVREEQERVERQERNEFLEASNAYANRRYGSGDNLRRLRRRNVYGMRAEVFTAIAAGATDPEDLRIVLEVAESCGAQVWGTTPLVSALRLNPATPSDVLAKLPPRGLTLKDGRDLESSAEFRKRREFQEQVLNDRGPLLRSGALSVHASALAERSFDSVQLERLFDVASVNPTEYPLDVMVKLAANPNISSTLAKRLFEFAATMDQQTAGSLLKALAANPAAPQDVSGSLSG